MPDMLQWFRSACIADQLAISHAEIAARREIVSTSNDKRVLLALGTKQDKIE